MLGLELSHAVRVEEVIEGDAEQVVERVAQVSLSAGRKLDESGSDESEI